MFSYTQRFATLCASKEINITEMLSEAARGYNQCVLVSEEDNAALVANTDLEILGIPSAAIHELLRISWYLESVSELLDEQYEEDYSYLSVVDGDEGIVRYNDIKIKVE